MMTKNADKKREQMMMFSMDDMVPQNHMPVSYTHLDVYKRQSQNRPGSFWRTADVLMQNPLTSTWHPAVSLPWKKRCLR